MMQGTRKKKAKEASNTIERTVRTLTGNNRRTVRRTQRSIGRGGKSLTVSE